MTIFSPYVYNWALGNKVYKTDGLVTSLKLLKHDHFHSAFIVGDGYGGLHANVTWTLDDVKMFSELGGKLTLSVGGANPPFLEDSCTEDQ